MPVRRKHSERTEERRQIFLDRSEKTIVEIGVRVLDRNALADRNQKASTLRMWSSTRLLAILASVNACCRA